MKEADVARAESQAKQIECFHFLLIRCPTVQSSTNARIHKPPKSSCTAQIAENAVIFSFLSISPSLSPLCVTRVHLLHSFVHRMSQHRKKGKTRQKEEDIEVESKSTLLDLSQYEPFTVPSSRKYLACFVFLLVFGIYYLSAYPNITGGDSGELVSGMLSSLLVCMYGVW